MPKDVEISDEEYVECIRKGIQNRHSKRWMWALLVVPSIICLILCGGIFQGLIGLLPEEKKMVYLGLLLGVMGGFWPSMIASQAGLHFKWWLDAINGTRTERLMLKYHDELKGRN